MALQVAIACQGGGIHGAFTSGVLEAILDHQDNNQQNGEEPEDDGFEICGLSGTSAGALNAFLVWYAMMLHHDSPSRFSEARMALDRLWEMFSAQRLGERGINLMGQCLFNLGRFGVSVKHPLPPYLHLWLMQALPAWSTLEAALSRNPLLLGMDLYLGEVRRTFYDFQALLEACAPRFDDVRDDEDAIAIERRKPRLLVGAVDVMNGRFETFDSFDTKGKRKRISLDAIEASGTLPEIHRSQRVDDDRREDNGDSLYWDGLFSQNPPIREFLTGQHKEAKPKEIWVIRINPQKISSEPIFLSSIEDRRNELAGNLSLNQELDFIGQVNDWIDDETIVKADKYQKVVAYVITMSHETSAGLNVDSKFNRDLGFINALREEGKERGERFLQLWEAGGLRPWWAKDEHGEPMRVDAIPETQHKEECEATTSMTT